MEYEESNKMMWYDTPIQISYNYTQNNEKSDTSGLYYSKIPMVYVTK